jgi:hypothetical protein
LTAIGAVKGPIDALIAKLRQTAKKTAPVVRKRLKVSNDYRYRGAFHEGKRAKHIEIVGEVYDEIEGLFGDPDYASAAKASAPEVIAACQALNAVLDAFNKPVRRLPVERQGVLPFAAVNSSLWFFAREGASSHPLPQPTFEDFDKGRVIESRRAPVQERLEHSNGSLCYLRGTSAYGKTTTALVIAFAEQRRGFAASYLDFSHDYDYDDASIVSAFEVLLARGEKQIVVIDNAHRNPRLVRSLRSRWDAVEKGKRPKFLIVGTRVSYPPTMQAEYVMHWPEESTLDLVLEPSNFGDIAKFYVTRARSWAIDPPELTQLTWSRLFANHLHAFTFAVLARAQQLGQDNNWALSVDHALTWIRENWLRRPGRGDSVPIGDKELDNLVTLCAFGDDRFELAVPEVALPHADEHLRHHRSMGVVLHSERTRPSRDTEQIYQLMEHGWGELILQAARIPLENREAIRAEAMARSPVLSLAVATRLRAYSSADLLALIESLDRGNWLETVASSSLSQAAGWLALLRGCDASRANVLAVALKARVQASPALLTSLTLGQLANLAEQIADARGPELETDKSSFFAGLALLDPPAGSILLESAEQELSTHQLAFMSRLTAGSPLRVKLEQAATKAIPFGIDAALERGLGTTMKLLELLKQKLPDVFETALEVLTEPSRAALLAGQIRAGRIRDLEPAHKFCQNGPTLNARAVDLIFRPLAGTDWAELTKEHERPCEGAPWLIKTFHFAGMKDDAARLAEFVARRAEVNDLLVNGKSQTGNKRIEMVARICQACPDDDLARTYLGAMSRPLARVISDQLLFRGLIADGLSILASCENLDLPASGLHAAIKVRLRQLPDPTDTTVSGIKAVGEHVRLIGSIASGWPTDLFDEEIKAFCDRVGIELIVNNPLVNVPQSPEPPEYLPPYQMQFWQGLFAISHLLQLELPVQPELRRQIHRLLQGNRKHQAENFPDSKRRAAWMKTFSDWLERTIAIGDGRS